jgi:hypothetical protein
MHVLGRPERAVTDEPTHPSASSAAAPTARLGTYRARDGSTGTAVAVDIDRPHVWLVAGKRGSGKSYTLGVLAEELGDIAGVSPVVLDPMGGLTGLAAARFDVRSAPTVRADALPPAAWPELVGLDAATPAGTLLWQAAAAASTLVGMRDYVRDADVAAAARRGAGNHLRLAASWGVFDPDGLDPATLLSGPGTVLDLSGLPAAPMNALVHAVCRGLYGTAVGSDDTRLPWVLLDEAHAFFDGVAAPALRTLLTRGRAPGVSLVVATQRPGVLPPVVASQADTLLAHRLTVEADVEALSAMVPASLRSTLQDRLPNERGCAVLVDDATDSAHGVRIRERRTPHGGDAPRASDRAADASPADHRPDG